MGDFLEAIAVIFGYGFMGSWIYFIVRYRDKSQDWRASALPAVIWALRWPYHLLRWSQEKLGDGSGVSSGVPGTSNTNRPGVAFDQRRAPTTSATPRASPLPPSPAKAAPPQPRPPASPGG